MTGTTMIRIITLLSMLAVALPGHAVLKLTLDGQTRDVATAVLDTANGLLTITSGLNLNCTGFTPVDPAQVPMAIQVDANSAAEIDNVTPASFTIQRVDPDTLVTVVTVDGGMVCSGGSGLPEVFFTDGFESPPPQ